MLYVRHYVRHSESAYASALWDLTFGVALGLLKGRAVIWVGPDNRSVLLPPPMRADQHVGDSEEHAQRGI